MISIQEHKFIYNDLSSNQELGMLANSKNLNRYLLWQVWLQKQELTASLVRKMLGPSGHIFATILILNPCGFPIVVDSNCICSSVKVILENVGVLPLVDVYISNEDVHNSKPALDIFIKTAQCFVLGPNEVLVIKDSTKVVDADSLAGCAWLRVNNLDEVGHVPILRRIFELEATAEQVSVVILLADTDPVLSIGGKGDSASLVEDDSKRK